MGGPDGCFTALAMEQLSGVRLKCERAPPPNSCLRRQTRNSWAGLWGYALRSACKEAIMSGVRTGGCACGLVRYALKGEPFRTGVCHCADCRKESGSVFVVYAQWRMPDVEILGETQAYNGRRFCPTCGSRLFEAYPEFIEIRIGSLDEAPSSIGSPQRESWIKRREPWLSPIAGAEQAKEDARDANVSSS